MINQILIKTLIVSLLIFRELKIYLSNKRNQVIIKIVLAENQVNNLFLK